MLQMSYFSDPAVCSNQSKSAGAPGARVDKAFDGSVTITA
jgi:hypothetical protein